MTKQSLTVTLLSLSVALPGLVRGDFELTDNIRVNGFLQNRTAFNLDGDPYIGEGPRPWTPPPITRRGTPCDSRMPPACSSTASSARRPPGTPTSI